jgi:DNA-binding NtrC family response regulator
MKNILIVDDEEDVLGIISDVVRKWGYNPIVAQDGGEGLEKYKQLSIDLVLTDVKMPRMDGMALLKEIKNLDKGAVVMMLTGYPSIDSAITAIKQGAYDYLVKPVNLDELKFKIERSLEWKTLIKSRAFVKGLNWALIISIPLWLVLGIILAKLLR